MVFLIVCVTALTLLISSWYLHYYKFHKHLAKYPAPTPLPILGHALYFRTTKVILPTIMRLFNIYGKNIPLFVGWNQGILTCDYKLVEFVLNSNTIMKKSVDYEYLKSWLGTGLLTSVGEKWRTHRKILTPAFHFKILEQFIDIFNSAGNVLIKKLRNEVGNESTNIYRFITLCALDVICETAMGTKVNAQENSNSEYVRSVKEMCRILMARANSPIKQSNFLYKFTRDYYKERKALEILHGYTNSVIQNRKRELEKNNIDQITDEFGTKRKLAFLDLMLNSTIDGKPLSDVDIREEVDTFMFEGHDTTSSAISFVLFCLANHRDIQEKVVNEVKTIFEDDPIRSVTYKDLQDMKYLEMVIKETLRLYPSVPGIARIIEEDIEYDGSILPKDLNIDIMIYAVGRNPDIFPDPEKFDPERFNVDNSIGRLPFSYLPFSAGSRNCIGQKFAMLEMKSLISKVLKNYELLPTDPPHQLQLVPEAVLMSANGVCIRLIERKF